MSLAFFEGSLLMDNYSLACVFHGLYYASFDWFLYAFLRYVLILSGKVVESKSNSVFKWGYVILAGIDSLILITNIKTKFVFDIEKIFIDGQFFSWLVNFNLYYYVHVALGYLVIGVIFLEFIYRIITIAKMYIFKYVVIFACFIIVLIFNTLFMFFMKYLMLDFSVLPFGTLSIIISLFSNFRIMRKLENDILNVVSQNISNPVICFDNKGSCIYKNSAADKLLSNEGVMDLCKSIAEKELDLSIKQEPVVVLNEEGQKEEHLFNIEYKWLHDKNDKLIGSFLAFEDVTIDVQNTLKEEYKAQHDELTGLYNRSYFFENVMSVIKEQPDVPRYLICTNISQFKIINDLFGQALGDNLLKKQAEFLEIPVKAYKNCVAGRISGDKFALLINKEDFKADIAIYNTQLLQDYLEGKNFRIHVSLGIYEIVNPYESVFSMYDKAMLALKSIGDDFSKMISFYDSSLMMKLINRKEIINDFQQALDASQISMYLQSQVDAKTGQCVGAEALARWIHVDKGLISPEIFVSVLEEAGLVYQLDFYIWRKAIQKLSDWSMKGLDYYISVNISPKDFYYADLYKELTELVEFYNVSPSKVNLEITETILLDDKRIHSDVLNKLRKYGFRIEMDDFGSGYSSFMALENMEVEVLKIDKEFLRETANNEKSHLILITIISMAKKLGMTVITEGVETEKEVEFLKKAGCDIFQGYYFSKPVSVSDFEEKYINRRDK